MLTEQPFTPEQLEARRPVWNTLSDLYLDTDTRPDLPRMARVLAESGLSEAELNTIWHDELTPALITNLSVPIGVWAYFDLDWLEGQIVKRRRYIRQFREGPKLTRWLRHIWDVKIWPNQVQPYFQTVMDLRGELLALPEPERQALADLWQWIAFSYFWPDTPVFGALPPGGLDAERVFAFLEPRLRPLLVASDARKMQLEQRCAHVLEHLSK